MHKRTDDNILVLLKIKAIYQQRVSIILQKFHQGFIFVNLNRYSSYLVFDLYYLIGCNLQELLIIVINKIEIENLT